MCSINSTKNRSEWANLSYEKAETEGEGIWASGIQGLYQVDGNISCRKYFIASFIILSFSLFL